MSATAGVRPMRVGRIPYVNCFPVYGAIDRGIVELDAELVDGVPTALNAMMADGSLDVSVVSAVEYARDWERYILLPDLAISCDGPVRSVLLFTDRPPDELDGKEVVVSRSSMTSIKLLELLFANVWHATPRFVPGDSETSDVDHLDLSRYPARLVIGDAALIMRARHLTVGAAGGAESFVHDLGYEWKRWTGLPFVFAVWVAQRTANTAAVMKTHAALIESRDWGLEHLSAFGEEASTRTGISKGDCVEYLSGLDYGLSLPHLKGLTTFFEKLVDAGAIPAGALKSFAISK